jgi:para-nitrobenzyl esterase
MSPRTTLRLTALATVLATALSAASTAQADPAPLVATTGGLVRGVAAGTNDHFLGIPYAAPPVGALRWQPPAPAARWSGVRNGSTFGPHCAQPAGPFGDASTSEDCLYLNVYAPAGTANAGHRHPVMVWIHGGALVSGASDLYDPTELVRNGVVVVTINYRLGALGFLAHPALVNSAGGPSGNYGLMDQQAALRWVERNITRFGGNAHDVTVFGESAGGLSVLSQLVSPGARGLFDRAIVQSGAYALTQVSLDTAKAGGQAFAGAAGCADQTAACLRSLSVETVLAHENTAGYQPNVDGRVLTESIGTSLAAGRFARVPVINGSNHDEWRLFVGLSELQGAPVTAANYQAMIASTLRVSDAAAAGIASVYPLSAYPSPALALSALGTDAIFACPALTVNKSVSKFVPTWAYEFNDANAPGLLPPVSFPYAAAHASELQYLFPTAGTALSPDQQRLAAAMRRYWTSFGLLGAPLTLGAPFWPRFDASTQRLQSFVPPRPQVETGFAADHKCSFWTPPA